MGKATETTIQIHITAPPRKDGYRPITDILWAWAQFPVSGSPYPTLKERRYLLSAARRCDTAHLQILRVRAGLTKSEQMGPEPDGWTVTSPLRRQLYETLGDAELAMVALNRAIDMAANLCSKLGIAFPLLKLPEIVERKKDDVRELRNAVEHIEDRALGLIGVGKNKKPHPDALTLFESFKTLFVDRTMTYAGHTLDIDREATDLLIAVRDYLRDAWVDICARG